MLDFRTNGNFIDLVYKEDDYPFYEHTIITLHNTSKCITWGYNEDSTIINFTIDDLTYDQIPISSIYFDGVVMSAQADFKTGIEAMFPGLAGGGSSYLVASVTLTDAQIKASQQTYIEVVPAPGAGKVISLINATLLFNFSAGAYTNVNADGVGGVAYGDWDADCSTYFRIANLGATNLQTMLIPVTTEITAGNWVGNFQGSMPAQSVIVNKPLKFFISNEGSGDFTGGNAANTLKVTVYYVVVDL